MPRIAMLPTFQRWNGEAIGAARQWRTKGAMVTPQNNELLTYFRNKTLCLYDFSPVVPPNGAPESAPAVRSLVDSHNTRRQQRSVTPVRNPLGVIRRVRLAELAAVCRPQRGAAVSGMYGSYQSVWVAHFSQNGPHSNRLLGRRPQPQHGPHPVPDL